MHLNEHLMHLFGDRTAPDGSLERENFAAWFVNSQVTNAEGRPLRMYHGTLDDFSRFDPNATQDGAFHFGTPAAAWDAVYNNPGYEEDIDEDGNPAPAIPPSLIPVYLSIQNPMRVNDQDDDWEAAIAKAKAEGHDGIVYKNKHEDKGSDSWIAFKPSQIKSAIGNSGAYNENDDDIADRQALKMANALRAKTLIDNPAVKLKIQLRN